MPAPASPFEQRRDALVARLQQLAREDERIVALWLQGSLAAGTADALSDVDAYLAVADEHFDAVYGARRELAGSLGELLIGVDSLIPGLLALHCVIDGPVKLDLFFERASQAPEMHRPAVRMLVDKAELGSRLKSGWQPSAGRVGQRVLAVLSGTLQGGT
ncbi:MAG TPA: nucleotidyltransferase domain-containing protein, partial [Dehalococcoidia bacterium]